MSISSGISWISIGRSLYGLSIQEMFLIFRFVSFLFGINRLSYDSLVSLVRDFDHPIGGGTLVFTRLIFLTEILGML